MIKLDLSYTASLKISINIDFCVCFLAASIHVEVLDINVYMYIYIYAYIYASRKLIDKYRSAARIFRIILSPFYSCQPIRTTRRYT